VGKKLKLPKLGSDNTNLYLVASIIFFGAVLRLVSLGHSPGLYFDEVLYGLDAYSILMTGKDIYGHFMPLAFQSSGYYPPLYPYTLLPFLAIFGLSAWVVRLPAALAGIGSLVVLYFLIKEVAGKSRKILALAATFMLAFLPWHIHLTRVSFLAIFGLAFLLSGTYFFIKGKKDNRFYILGTLLLAASTQAHYGYKLLAPVIFLELCIFEFKNFSKQKSLLLGVILIWAGAILVSAVSYSKYNTNFRVAELVNNNVFMVIREYFRSFSLNFLFINGDYYRLNNPWGTGILPLVMLPYVLLGLVGFFKQNRAVKFIIGSILIFSPMPTAIAGAGQQSVRNSPMILAFIFIAALGVELLLKISGRKIVFRSFVLVSAIIFLISSGNKVEYLFTKYDIEYGDLWGKNQRAAIEFANEQKTQNIVFTDAYNVMLNYYAFDQIVSPALLQKTTLSPTNYYGLPAKNIDNAYFLSTEQGFDRNYFKNLPAKTVIVDTFFYSDNPLFSTVKSGDKNIFQYLRVPGVFP